MLFYCQILLPKDSLRSTVLPIMSLSKHLKTKPSSLKISKEISRGGNGSVYEGEFEGRPVAVKKIHGVLLEGVRDGQGDAVLTAFGSECKRLESIVHPQIVEFFWQLCLYNYSYSIYQYKCSIHYVLCYGRLYWHFGCKLYGDESLIKKSVQFKIHQILHTLCGY